MKKRGKGRMGRRGDKAAAALLWSLGGDRGCSRGEEREGKERKGKEREGKGREERTIIHMYSEIGR